jgi:hypothetical protein
MKFLNTCAFLACGLVAISMGFSTLAVASEPGSDAAIEKEEEKEQITSSRVWPPRYQDRRFKEDWAPVDWTMDRSALPWYDRIKVVPLTKDNSIWASFGGQARPGQVSFCHPGVSRLWQHIYRNSRFPDAEDKD